MTGKRLVRNLGWAKSLVLFTSTLAAAVGVSINHPVANTTYSEHATIIASGAVSQGEDDPAVSGVGLYLSRFSSNSDIGIIYDSADANYVPNSPGGTGGIWNTDGVTTFSAECGTLPSGNNPMQIRAHAMNPSLGALKSGVNYIYALVDVRVICGD